MDGYVTTIAPRGTFVALGGFQRFDLRPLGNVTAPGGEPLARALLSVEMVMFAYAFDGRDRRVRRRGRRHLRAADETSTAFNASSLNASVDDASFGGDDSPPPGGRGERDVANASAARHLGRDARLT